MNPFYWREGVPNEEGWYLACYIRRNRYVFDVAQWNGEDWVFSFNKPEEVIKCYHKITPPNEFFQELEREAADRQRADAEAKTRQEQKTNYPDPFLGSN